MSVLPRRTPSEREKIAYQLARKIHKAVDITFTGGLREMVRNPDGFEMFIEDKRSQYNAILRNRARE